MTDYEFVGDSSRSFSNQPELTAWEAYRSHREIVTQSTINCAPEGARSLCVLGAGFCNDIDLGHLSNRFETITLVDINGEDVEKGLKHQRCDPSGCIQVVGGLDLSGVNDLLKQFVQEPNGSLVDPIIRVAGEYVPRQLEQYDCVVSTCVLSQLLCAASDAVSHDHPKFVELIQTIRKRHILIMLNSLSPGGAGLLITDFVSTDSLPDLFETKDLKTTLKRAVANNNFLHGLNPAAVGNEFRSDEIEPFINSLKVTDPWRWAMPSKIYACFAIAFTKK